MSEKNYTIFSVCNRIPTESYYCFNEFLKSIEGTNNLIVSAVGNQYTGLCDKPKFLYRILKEGLIKTEYIIICDSWDLVFACPPEDIIETYLAFNADIVISAEKNCFPDDTKKEYDKLNSLGSAYKYLNSGFIVGKTESVLKMLEAMKVEDIPSDYYDTEKGCNIHFNDQFEYQKIFLQQPVLIDLDYKQILCNTLHSVSLDDFDFSKDRIFNKETKTYPCAFHFNGSAKTDGLREPILKHLNLLP